MSCHYLGKDANSGANFIFEWAVWISLTLLFGEFLVTIREKNPSKEIVIISDIFNSHKADYSRQISGDCSINLVYLPKYSPDLNPIEYIWKSIKRVISQRFVRDIDHMRALIRGSFLENASKLSFAGYWIERFLGGEDWYKKFGFWL